MGINKETIKELAKTNDSWYNICKLIEELNELSTALTQKLTKTHDDAGINENIIEELGDVKYRMKIFIESEDVSKQAIKERVAKKLDKCLKHLKEGKYKNV